MTPEQAAAEILRREAAKEHILDYIRYMRPAHLPDFHHEPAAHHRIAFAPFLDEMHAALRHRTEENDRGAVSVPPGAAKSFYYSITWPTQLLAADPRLKIICVSAAESLAEDFARRRRQIMLSKQWQDLAECSLSPDAKGLAFQGTPYGGGIYAYGAGSTIQGIRADVLIGDDLVTGHEEAGNLTQLDKKWNWYISEARPRLRPGGIEALIATRWALLDPIGRVLRLTQQGAEVWRYLRIPHVCDSEDDPVGRKIGERLWPEYFTQRMMEDAMRNPLVWNTLHQQNPAVSEHSWVPLDCIQLENKPPEHLRFYIGVDISLGIDGRDWTVFAVIGIDERKSMWLVDLVRLQVDSNQSARRFIALCQQYQPRYAWVENDNTSIMWGKIVDMEAAAMGVRVPLQISKMKNRDKEVRAAPLQNMFIQRRVFILRQDWTQQVIRELAEFPDGRNDDIVDAVGVVAKELRKITGPVLATPIEKQPIVGSMQVKNGKLMTTQTLDEIAPLKTLNAGRRRI